MCDACKDFVSVTLMMLHCVITTQYTAVFVSDINDVTRGYEPSFQAIMVFQDILLLSKFCVFTFRFLQCTSSLMLL